jgi:hypothetical protein
MRIHFVYAGTPDEGRNCSPYTITKNLHRFLSQRAEVIYHHWDAHYDIDLQPDDILLGHPNYDPGTVVQRAFRSDKPCRAKCTIHPLHHGRPEDNMPFDEISRKATAIFSIMGKYWYDTLEQSSFAHWKPKITRLDMSVNADIYQYLKGDFNNVGSRGIVYVGSSMPQKNLGMLTQLASRMPDVKFEWYGGSSDHPLFRLPNTYVEGWQDLGQDKLRTICARNDIIISTSCSDANPTTIAEVGLASGLIPICTRESGYYDSSVVSILLNDINGSIRILREWLNKPSGVLKEMSLRNRETCVRDYNWDVFCNTVWNRLSQL